MGPAAGADLVRLFVQACTEFMQRRGWEVRDQSYPTHWLAQVPVPDRTEALNAGGTALEAPLDAMTAAAERLQALGAGAVAIACNTAHAWHEALQARFPHIELLHVARETAKRLQATGVGRVGLLATRGTYRTGLYETALAHAGIACHLPDETGRELLMRGIYDGVKAGDMAGARDCFVEAARRLMAGHGDVPLIMGCTEIPLALEDAPQAASWTLVNPGRVLAQALARRAYADWL
ncbi:MAG: amino acid racemase [Ramlibacter sp.]|nr:amino acid racemase [Ramlibacter sp.]